jgi:hypothetical protein
MSMRRSIIGVTVLALVATGAYAVLAGDQCNKPCATSAQASAGSTCSPAQSAASSATPRGKVAGHFDPAMSGVCRFACATTLKYNAKDVLAQPGAKAGKLTQCPVSGVVFAVDANRPRVRIASDEYMTCCDKCATKLKRDPRHYLKV